MSGEIFYTGELTKRFMKENFNPKNKEDKRAQKHFKLFEEFLKFSLFYANIIHNNYCKHVDDINFVSVDQSLNGTGICFSARIKLSENNVEYFYRFSKIISLVFGSMSRRSTPQLIKYLRKRNFQFDERFSEYEHNIILHSFFRHAVLVYDSYNQTVCLCSKMANNSLNIEGDLNKLSFIYGAIDFICKNYAQVISTLMNLVLEMIELVHNENLDMISPAHVNTFMSFHDLEPVSEEIYGLVVNCKKTAAISFVANITSSINARSNSFHYSLEEVSSSVDFVGVRANGMSYGAASVALTLNARGALVRSLLVGRPFQPMFFLLNKSTLQAYCARVLKHLESFSDNSDLEEIAEELIPYLDEKEAKNKGPQLVLFSFFTGLTIKDNDIADAFCHNILLTNYYCALEAIIGKMIESNVLTIEKSEDKNLPYLISLVKIAKRFESDDITYQDFAYWCADIIEFGKSLCDDLQIDLKSFVNYMSNNFAREVNRLFYIENSIGGEDA